MATLDPQAEAAMAPDAPAEKKIWSCPDVKNYGSFAEATQLTVTCKDPGPGDGLGASFVECPRVS